MVRKKIVHIIIACFYKEGFGYQENILPAKHVELGYDVTIITIKRNEYNQSYINRDGVKVKLLDANKSLFMKLPFFKILNSKTKGLHHKLIEINPDIIFIHGSQAIDNLSVVKYKKHNPNVQVFVDQHGDYYNMPINTLKNWFIQKVVFRFVAQKLASISEMMWGVTPWRVEYLQKVYGVNKEKTGLLVMGGDEKLIDWESKTLIRYNIRKSYNIPEDCFLIITGGKIDSNKNIHLLSDAVIALNNSNIKLMIFGKYEKDMKNIIVMNDSIIDVGWIDSKEVYALFLASDLGFFPGTHSVLWEQAVASGLPCVFKKWGEGMKHLDVGGNCLFLEDITISTIKGIILELYENAENYKNMELVANTIARKEFSYLEIAKHSILYKE